MNVLHVITGLEDGGAEAVLYRLIRATPHVSHQVVGLTGSGKYAALLQAAGVRTSCLGMPRGRVTLSGLIKLARLIRASSPDVVQTWMYHADLIGGVMARVLGRGPVVWGVHNGEIDHSPRSTRAVVRISGAISTLVARGIIFCSARSVGLHQRFGYGVPEIRVIPNGYDGDIFRRDPEARQRLRTEWGVAENEVALGFVARYDPVKDHATLIDAVGQLVRENRPVRCILVGTGMDSSQGDLIQLLKQHGISDRVVLAGRRSDIPQVMSALDLHVLTSRSEAFPNVLCEAMLCEVPCVSTDVGDAAQIIDGLGWIVPPASPHILADAIRNALDEMVRPLTWQERGERCRASILARFGVMRMAATYVDFWKTISKK